MAMWDEITELIYQGFRRTSVGRLQRYRYAIEHYVLTLDVTLHVTQTSEQY